MRREGCCGWKQVKHMEGFADKHTEEVRLNGPPNSEDRQGQSCMQSDVRNAVGFTLSRYSDPITFKKLIWHNPEKGLT